MTSNMYGYTDYNGPLLDDRECVEPSKRHPDDEDDEETDPLRSGLWMEGDSLAPPCGTSVSTIHKMLEFASVSSDDILYDFGCGDGRVCLEALVRHSCLQCVGVEVEEDLVMRFQYLISSLPESLSIARVNNFPRIQAVQADLRHVLAALVKRAAVTVDVLGHNESVSCDSFGTLPLPTVMILYLLPEAIAELEHDLIALLKCLPNFRIVCNTWGLPTVLPTLSLEINEATAGASTILKLYNSNCVGQ